MKVKEIIKLNNEKRKILSKENVVEYEDMLVYIRLASNKSERETEEILLELLEHIIQAQAEDRTVRDVFGTDLKLYCQELIEEIPKETWKKQIHFSLYIILGFLSMASLTYGILGYALSFFFDLELATTTFSIGSSIIITVLNLLIAILLIVWLLKWLKASVFIEKKKNKWLEFIQLWLASMASFSLFFLIAYFMPDFGPEITISTALFIGIGIVLNLISRLFKH